MGPMSAPDEALLEHENWIAYLTGAVRCAGGAPVARDGGVVSILTGLPFDWINQVLIERAEATPADLLAGVIRARERGYPFVVRLRDGVDDRFVPALWSAGLERMAEGSTTPGMLAFPIDRDLIRAQDAPDLDIRRVTDAAGLDDHRLVATAGFGTDPAVALGMACEALLDLPGCAIYAGYANGAAVVSGFGLQTGRTIGVYTIATVPPARRRGYGAAMTSRVVLDGVAAGCDVAILQASEMGRPIYERLGFRTVVRYSAYARSG
jgi:GNAT superfamily N-acetyltransferase